MNKNKKETLLDFDKVLGIGIDHIQTTNTNKNQEINEEQIPEEIKKLLEERKISRENKD
jgi:ribosomal protein L19E